MPEADRSHASVSGGEAVSRSEFFLKFAVGAAGVGLTTGLVGCRGLAERVTSGAAEGALEGAEEFINERPELKDRLDDLVRDLERTAENARLTSEKTAELTEKAKQMLDRNEDNIDQILETAGESAGAVQSLFDALRRAHTFLETLTDPTDLLNALLYLFRELARRIALGLATLLVYLFAVQFRAFLRRLIDELRRQLWPFDLFARII